MPTGLPARNAATALRSTSVRAEPCRNIWPLVSVTRMLSGASVARISRLGARESIGVAGRATRLVDGRAIGGLCGGRCSQHANEQQRYEGRHRSHRFGAPGLNVLKKVREMRGFIIESARIHARSLPIL